MDSLQLHQQIWESSSSKAFYNSPQHAVFMASNGENIQLVKLNGSLGDVYIPISFPTVWTWLGNTKIPIPPKFGPRNSTYLGLLATGTGGLGSPSSLLDDLLAKRNIFQPSVRIIQPVLLETGITPNLDLWVDEIESKGITHSKTESRIVELPQGRLDGDSEAFNGLLESSNFTELLESYDSKRRYDIRRAPRVGVRLEIESIKNDQRAQEIYSSIMPLHKESWLRTGLGPHSLNYWTGFSKSVRDSGVKI